MVILSKQCTQWEEKESRHEEFESVNMIVTSRVVQVLQIRHYDWMLHMVT